MPVLSIGGYKYTATGPVGGRGKQRKNRMKEWLWWLNWRWSPSVSPVCMYMSQSSNCPYSHLHCRTTYLDDHSSFGVMFYLKHKNEEFAAFKTHKAWAERQLNTTLKCKRTDQGGEFMSNEQKAYLAENRIKHQTSMPDSPQQNGQAERFQQTIVNGAEAMWHHAGLSNGFWIYAVKAKLHTYNIDMPRTQQRSMKPEI